MAWESGATPVVVLTKADLSDAVDEQVVEAANVAPGVDVHAVSVVTGQGLDELAGHFEPGRAVRRAVEDGELPADRLAGWHKLQRELRALEVRHDQRARAEQRRRRRVVNKAIRDHAKRAQ